MNKLLEVREFDIITCNENYKDIDNYKYLKKEVFDDLAEFIREFTSTAENSDILNFLRIGYKRNVGDIIIAKNYVGLIQMKNGYQVQILPKIDFDNEDDVKNTKTKKIFLKMLRSMKDFPSKVFNDSSIKIDRMNLYEIFINMYLQEVRQLVKHGVKSAYVEKEDNLKFFKGKLQINKHIRNNVTHKERFYITYDEYSSNRAENKLIKATLLKLQKITTSAENSKEIKQLLTAFEMVDESTNFTKDFSKVSIDRNTGDYKLLMQWSKVFLMNKSFTTFSGKNNSRALLFPMESVYEAYVAKQIKKIMIPLGWDVASQDRGHHLFEEPKKKFSLRPDLVLTNGTRTIIMDTKWKKLTNNERSNYGISQSDMYQMYAYSKKYNTPEIWLLYPLTNEMRNHSDIYYDSNDGTVVKVFFIDIDDIKTSLKELANKIA